MKIGTGFGASKNLLTAVIFQLFTKLPEKETRWRFRENLTTHKVPLKY